MPWVEGVGDEVTITLTVLLGICILLAAWLSTGTRDIRFISVIIVQLRRRVGQANDALNSATGNTTVTNANTSEPAEIGEQTGEVSEATSQESVETNVVEVIDNTALNAARSESDIILNEGELRADASGGKDLNSSEIHNRSESEFEAHVVEEFEAETRETVAETRDTTESQLDDESEVDDDSNLSENELRRRRVQFFSGQSDQSCSSAKDESGEKRTSACVNEGVQETVVASNNVPKLDRVPDTSSDSSCSQPAASDVGVDCVIDNRTDAGVDSVIDNRTDAGSSRLEPESRGETVNETSGVNPSVDNVGQSPPDEIRVRIKFFNDTQKLVTSHPRETIGTFRQKHFPTELSQSKLVRFIFNGQDLRNDSSTLQSYNIIDNSVLHCLITQPRQQDQQQQHLDDEDGLDLGYFMFPLFGLLLVILWYIRLMYKQFFNVKSTLVLAGMSFLYLAALMSSIRRQRDRPAHEHLD